MLAFLKKHSVLLSWVTTLIALSTTFYLKITAVFVDENFALLVTYTAIVSAFLGIIFSFLSFPARSCFATLAILMYLTYFLFFTSLYGIH